MEPKDSLDEILKPLGGFGKFQKFTVGCLTLITVFCGISQISFAMTAGTLKHRCLLSECEELENSYNQPCMPSLIPNTSSGDYAACLRLNATGSENSYECNEYIYETEEWTIAREDWGIHCDDDQWLLALLGSLNNAGQFLGGFYVGFLSDRFGRKRALVSLTVLAATLGVIKSFSVNFPMMATIEFIEATLAVHLFAGPLVVAMEIVKPSKRVLVGAILSSAYPIGETILAAVQWLTLDWRTSVRILYAPFLLTISYIWFMPESVRWLLNNKRSDEATSVLRNLAKRNGKEFPESIVKRIKSLELEQEDCNGIDKKAAVLELAKSPRMRIRFIACYFLWIANVFVYFGLTLNSVSINDNKFLNFILTALIEIPSCAITTFILDRIGRRRTLSASFGLCGVACLVFAFLPDDESLSLLKLVIYLAGKFCSSSGYLALSVYTTELFPTSLRSSVMSWMLTGGKMASILVPQTPLLSDIFKPLPLLIFSALALLASTLTLSFPETLNSRLPDTVEEAEKLGRIHTEPSS